MLPETLTSATGPLSIYTYEYEKGTAMDVCYKSFGDDPVYLLYVRQFNVPQSINGGAREAIIKIEVRVLVVFTSTLITFSYALFHRLNPCRLQASTISVSDCRIRQGLWWGMDEAPLSNTPGVDMVGKIDKIDALSMIKYRF